MSSAFAAQPLNVRPEFLHTSSCGTFPAFGTRLTVLVGGGHDLILRGMRFGFTDRVGSQALPEVLSITSLTSQLPASTLPSSSPIAFPGIAALPGASAVSIPGSSPIHGVYVPGGTSRSFSFFLRFGCGFFADGVLLITIDAADHHGRFDTSHLRVRVGS